MALPTVDRESVGDRYARIGPWLDERQRRLWLGNEALALGRGGLKLVAAATGAHPDTVARGRDEFDSTVTPSGRVRHAGAGRKGSAERDPELAEALLALAAPASRDDPESALVWILRSTASLAAALSLARHPVSARTVAAILTDVGYCLQANVRTVEGEQHPDRDAQFRYVADRVDEHLAAGDPVISVDCKKTENGVSGGREWRPAVYTGWDSVRSDHETAAFAVDTIRTWWQHLGCADFPSADRMLICAAAGGANRFGRRTWNSRIADLSTETGLAISACRLPPGTFKWNWIEHRMIFQITQNMRGRRPLTSHEIIVNTIAAPPPDMTMHADSTPATTNRHRTHRHRDERHPAHQASVPGE